MIRLMHVMPAIVAVLTLTWLTSKLVPPTDADGAFHVQAFGRLPVVYQGRVKPFDTLARNSLILVSDRQTWRDEEGRRRPAIEWLLDVMSSSSRAGTDTVFRIHDHQLLTQLGLERRKGYRYALDEFETRLPELERQAARASVLEPGERDVYDVNVLEFYRKVTLHRVLAETHAIADPTSLARRYDMLERFSLPHAIPPRAQGDGWKSMIGAAVEDLTGPERDTAVRRLGGMLDAWANGDPDAFNAELASYRAYLRTLPGAAEPAIGFEVMFNHFAPFYRCSLLYVLVFTLICFAWLGWTENLRRIAFSLLLTTFTVHTLAIGARVYISGYPPITNLYGTAVFIGWASVLLGLLLEWIYRLGIGTLLSATVGFLTLLIAHFLAGDGDTLEMMQAVLDTKFWLATHVVIINFGYAATFLAGGLAAVFILRGVLTRSLDVGVERMLGRMIYGVLCFALLLSFLGTVLGGLWADDSWGRFWGWDPKENGALMIVLWNALILHARWGGMIKTRGIAVLSVFGNIVTAWSWFGVNQLGVGLHSYGFTESVVFWLLLFVASQLLLIGVGLVPRRAWRSPSASAAPPAQ